ncbi:tetratricopeptide repeat protein [Phycisphaerales bacterium ac7]
MPLSTNIVLAAGLLVVAGVTPALAGPDDSVWYQSPQQAPPSTPSATPAPSQPSGSSVQVCASSGSVYFNVGGGDYYYPFGTNYPIITYGRGGYYGRYYYPRSYRYYRTYDTPDTSTLIELARRYDPALIGADANAEPPTDRELGERAMRRGDYEQAIVLFASAADEQRRSETGAAQPNRQAQRLLGIAYAADGQYDTAGGQLAEAFEADPSLRTIPIRGDELFGPGLELNSIVSRAVGHAHRKPSYEAWFTVAVLMQAQGKNELANEMIQRAEAARKAAATPPGDAQAPKPIDAKPAKPAVEPETEADRLRRELQESTERLLETQRRLEEMKRKQQQTEAESEDDTDA